MKTTLVIATTVENINESQESIYYIASTIERAEEELISKGYTKITDNWEEGGYQTWYKKTEATPFCKEVKTLVSVVKCHNFIG